jgi:hypothetical protein
MAFFTPAILGSIALASLATGAAGTYMGSQAAQNANKTQAAIGAAGLQNAQNQQQYQQALNALAMQRSIAATTDGAGNTTEYDPATNSWKTTLTPEQARLQGASDQASISRNTTDLATSQEANNNAMKQAIAARSAAGPALADIQNFKPLSQEGLEGQLQETATTANRQAQQPVIADTLRSFARTGTAAGPVLTNMMRDNATSLRQTMVGDQLAAMKNVGDINNSKMAGLNNTYSSLNQASHPSLNFSPIDGTNPNAAILQAITARAGGAAQPASMGAYSSSASTNATNNALQYAGNHPGADNTGATISAFGDQLDAAFKPGSALTKWLNGPSSPPTLSAAQNPFAGFTQSDSNFGDVGAQFTNSPSQFT